MRKIIIDFETYCDLDIQLVGAFKYASHSSCRILCLSYKIDDAETKLWTPDLPWPDELTIRSSDKLYAFSATFEYLIWNYIGVKDWPEFFAALEETYFIDIRALCARYRMPQNLRAAGIALGCKTEKMVVGKKLIRLCCTPGHNPTPQDFQDLYTYCLIDTDVAYEVLHKLPADHFIPTEQALWELTLRMNEKGVPIDEPSVDKIIKYLAIYMEEMKAALPEITNGSINTPGQVQKIKLYCKNNGVTIPNLQADTVKDYLKKDIPDNVRAVLEIRQIAGMTSIKKFITIKNYINNGYVQGNLNFHGAGTGRWAGQGFQFHNLPRAKHKDPEKWIKKFVNGEPIDRPIDIAKALIRPMIKAPEGYKLIVSDYSSIENRMLAWMSDDTHALKLFVKDYCQYTDMAATLYNIPYSDIDPEGDQRQMGKVVILGCGYQMGARRFQAVAADWGFDITMAQATDIITTYRRKYVKVVNLWKAVDLAAKTCVRYPGRVETAGKCLFQVVQDKNTRRWLRITLPSSRSMMYADPRVSDGNYGPVVKYTGLYAKTHQMMSMALTPGLITENIVQGASRDVLANGKLMIDKQMPSAKLILSVHDEAGALIRDEDIYDTTMSTFDDLLCAPLSWANGLPLKAKGYIAQRYRKD